MSQTLQAAYAAKRKARRFAVQGIYEWQMSHNPVHEIEARTVPKMPCTKLILTITMNC
jgi:N utilization substance protein B